MTQWQCPKCMEKFEADVPDCCPKVINYIKITHMDPAIMIEKYGAPTMPLRKPRIKEDGTVENLQGFRGSIERDKERHSRNGRKGTPTDNAEQRRSKRP